MESLETIQERIREAVPEAAVEIIPNGGAADQPSLRVNASRARAVARFLRDDPELRLDYCSNVTGIDRPDRTVKETVVEKEQTEEGPRDRKKTVERVVSGYLEAVYHLYSISRKTGPLVLRMRTENRTDRVELPSLTPVWRSAELQEREIYDLFGIRFTGHPDLRRLLMWDEFEGYPMRKDYKPEAEAESIADDEMPSGK